MFAKAYSKAAWSFGLSAGVLTETPSFSASSLMMVNSQLQELRKTAFCLCHLHSLKH